MVDGHPVALRKRGGAASEPGKGSYPDFAEFSGVGRGIGEAMAWLKRNHGHVIPKPRERS
jgi:hypothetical protein